MNNMDIGESCEEKHQGCTPTLSNDSGYITATPSTLCNDSPDKICANDLSIRGPNEHEIYETPLTSQKAGKLSSLRKHRGENYTSLKLENVKEYLDDGLHYSSPYAVDEKEDSLYNPESDRNGTLAECFRHLLVAETACETKTTADVRASREEKTLFRAKSENRFVNSKKKSGVFLGKSVTKKFKHDISSVQGKTEITGHCSRRQCSYCGKSRLDFLAHFAGVSGSFPVIISRILSYLHPEDLVTVCLVSSEWRRICVDDPVANRRRLAHVRHVKHAKENITWEKFKQAGHSINLNLASSKGIFREIQNTDRRGSNSSTPTTSSTPRSPPVSPSKVRFKLFFKAGIALDEGTHLIRCPRCSHPSQATSDRARCQAVGCQYSFCVFCLCDIHEGFPCRRHSPPLVRRKICIGSKESRRNLRRL